MSNLKTSPYPGQNESQKAVVELSSSEGAGAIKLEGDPRLCFRLLAEAMIQLGPNIRDGMGDDFEYWKRDVFQKVFEACFGDIDEAVKNIDDELEKLLKEIKALAKKNGIVIDADAIV